MLFHFALNGWHLKASAAARGKLCEAMTARQANIVCKAMLCYLRPEVADYFWLHGRPVGCDIPGATREALLARTVITVTISIYPRE